MAIFLEPVIGPAADASTSLGGLLEFIDIKRV
jgi:hypothetical protein